MLQWDELGLQGQMQWCSGTHIAQESTLGTSLPNSTVNGIMLVARNQPWWKYLHHGDRQTLQSGALTFLQRAGC